MTLVRKFEERIQRTGYLIYNILGSSAMGIEKLMSFASHFKDPLPHYSLHQLVTGIELAFLPHRLRRLRGPIRNSTARTRMNLLYIPQSLIPILVVWRRKACCRLRSHQKNISITQHIEIRIAVSNIIPWVQVLLEIRFVGILCPYTS